MFFFSSPPPPLKPRFKSAARRMCWQSSGCISLGAPYVESQWVCFFISALPLSHASSTLKCHSLNLCRWRAWSPALLRHASSLRHSPNTKLGLSFFLPVCPHLCGFGLSNQIWKKKERKKFLPTMFCVDNCNFQRLRLFKFNFTCSLGGKLQTPSVGKIFLPDLCQRISFKLFTSSHRVWTF